MVYWQCIGGVLTVSYGDVVAVYRCCSGNVLVVYWQCIGGVVAVSYGDVVAMYWWCSGSVL